MSTPQDQEILDFPLEVDEAALEERSMGAAQAASLIDEEIRLLLHENRLSLWRGPIGRYSALNGSSAILDIPLRCTAHAHSECEFRWIRLTADFRIPPGISVTDIIPKQDVHTEPVKIIVKSSTGASFETETFKIGPNASREKSKEYQVYFPKLTTSGVGTSSAVWQFDALPEEVLYIDSDLRVRVSLATNITELSPRFILRGRLLVKGLARWIPVVGYRTLTLQTSDDSLPV